MRLNKCDWNGQVPLDLGCLLSDENIECNIVLRGFGMVTINPNFPEFAEQFGQKVLLLSYWMSLRFNGFFKPSYISNEVLNDPAGRHMLIKSPR